MEIRMEEKDKRVLKVLAKQYRNVAAASTEIINLQSILNLPKGDRTFFDGYTRGI